ncbi:nuclear pore complex protein NUP205-like isoform X3 [Phoenix dactylifera]|uniref:Nuclear pore complex protein NUP205-like isoform X3 n=1 Tax=Phoenix dactylifera TaxID=42345 RepID=A0A8B9AD92_PHODC|nr:nuclear pore complex protein NUP205-like isoform X3 [Phoenix dactylifera]
MDPYYTELMAAEARRERYPSTVSFLNLLNVLTCYQIQDINELSRQEVDEIINATMRHDCISSYDKIWKRVSMQCGR